MNWKYFKTEQDLLIDIQQHYIWTMLVLGLFSTMKYFLMQNGFLTFCSKIMFCLISFMNTLSWPTLQLLRVSYFNVIVSIVRRTFFFRLAPRWHWSGSSYFNQTQLNNGFSIGLGGSFERSPQFTLKKK